MAMANKEKVKVAELERDLPNARARLTVLDGLLTLLVEGVREEVGRIAHEAAVTVSR